MGYPRKLAKYTNDHFNKFIPEQNLQEKNLVENPVPLNLHPPRKRSSRPEVFCENGVLRNFTKFAEKHLRQSLFFNKVAGRPLVAATAERWLNF